MEEDVQHFARHEEIGLEVKLGTEHTPQLVGQVLDLAAARGFGEDLVRVFPDRQELLAYREEFEQPRSRAESVRDGLDPRRKVADPHVGIVQADPVQSSRGIELGAEFAVRDDHPLEHLVGPRQGHKRLPGSVGL